MPSAASIALTRSGHSSSGGAPIAEVTFLGCSVFSYGYEYSTPKRGLAAPVDRQPLPRGHHLLLLAAQRAFSNLTFAGCRTARVAQGVGPKAFSERRLIL